VQTLAGILLLVSVAMNASLMLFFAGVLRKVMNEMDEAAFKRFLEALVRHSTKSPFMLTIFNLPFLGAIPYFYFYGLRNWWMLAGIGVWLGVGLVAKAIKYPLYKRVKALSDGDVAQLRMERATMNKWNVVQAVLNVVAAALMVVPFVG
jgi:hypothetical protein